MKDRETMKNRKMILDIVQHVLAETRSEKLLKKYLKPQSYKKYNRIYIIGIGKAADTMVHATKHILKQYKIRTVPNVLLANSGHPLPTKKGASNTKKILALKGKLRDTDLVLVMLSGGGSSMLVSPPKGVTLQDKIFVTKQLLKSGATINEVNIVRKHISQIKGGRLAKILHPAHVEAFTISDVIGNDLATIASGPLSADKSTFRYAEKIIKKYRIRLPKSIQAHFKKAKKDESLESIKPGDTALKNINIQVIADHFTAADIAAKYAKKRGLKTFAKTEYIKGEARDTAKTLVNQFKKIAQPKSILIGCGETTVTCKGSGYGGRNQEFVLAGLTHISADETLASIGTDGVDGMCPEQVAGAIADKEISQIALRKNLSVSSFLRNNDSYSFFKKVGGLIKTGPTGTNLGDLVLLLKI